MTDYVKSKSKEVRIAYYSETIKELHISRRRKKANKSKRKGRKSSEIQYDREWWENQSSKDNVLLAVEVLKIIKEIDSEYELSYNQQQYIGLVKNGIHNNFVKCVPKKTFFRIRLKHKINNEMNEIIKKNKLNLEKIVERNNRNGYEDRYWIKLSKEDIQAKKNGLKILIEKSYFASI